LTTDLAGVPDGPAGVVDRSTFRTDPSSLVVDSTGRGDGEGLVDAGLVLKVGASADPVTAPAVVGLPGRTADSPDFFLADEPPIVRGVDFAPDVARVAVPLILSGTDLDCSVIKPTCSDVPGHTRAHDRPNLPRPRERATDCEDDCYGGPGWQ
jgi:hypothetical protein